MNFEANELLDRVDRWKLKLAGSLGRMSARQRAAFWKEVEAKAAALGLPLAHAERNRAPRRPSRKSG